MVTHQIFAENIKCDGCVASIKEGLFKMKGVIAVEVDKAIHKVCVTGIALEKKDLVDKLSSLGYPEKGGNNIFSKARSFVACTMEKLS
jgi:copper chaperone CopZ